MTVMIGLLKGVNVGGHRPVSMADLRELCAGLGYEGVRTILQSGNVVFRAARAKPGAIEKRLQIEASARLGIDTEVFVRTAEQWREIVRGNPFHAEAKRDPAHLLVMCLKEAPGARAKAALEAAITGRERVRLAGREAYLVYPDGIGRSRLTSAVIESRLQTSGTARNWNTVRKLEAQAAG